MVYRSSHHIWKEQVHVRLVSVGVNRLHSRSEADTNDHRDQGHVCLEEIALAEEAYGDDNGEEGCCGPNNLVKRNGD